MVVIESAMNLWLHISRNSIIIMCERASHQHLTSSSSRIVVVAIVASSFLEDQCLLFDSSHTALQR